MRYSYGPTPFPVKNNNSNIDIRDAQILSEKINDLKANNKLYIKKNFSYENVVREKFLLYKICG